MPKQFKTYDRFEGGLNTKTNSRSIKDNELAYTENVIFDEFGLIKNGSYFEDNTTDYTAPSIDATEPGYGLFQATFDFDAGGDNFPMVRTFLADTDDTSDTRIDIADSDGPWSEDQIDLGTDAHGQVIYHIADGAVRICDTNTANTGNAIKYYGYVNGSGRWLDSAGSVQAVGGHTGANAWNTFDVKLSPPTSGVVSLSTFQTALAAGGGTSTLISSVATAFAGMNTELDKGTYYAINDTDLTVDTLISRGSDTTLTTAAGGADWGTGGELYSIYPPSGTGFNLDVTVTGSEGTWPAGTYEFASTFVYDEIQESLLYNMSGTVVVTENDKLTCTALGTEFISSVNYDYRITGARFYTRISGSDDAWVLLGEVHLRFGSRPSLSGDYTYWVMPNVSGTNYYTYTQFVSLSKNIDTYESINTFSHDSPYNSIGADGENYKTSVVANRRTFIAGVQRFGPTGIRINRPDSIFYSELNKFDTFPTLNYIDIGINDGESFIKIESFADRLLAFKEKTLYIINIGGGSDTQWFLESEHKNMGVGFHAAVVKTEFGIAWVNKNGLFFYDGNQIRNLQNKILESEWSSFVNSTSFTDATCDTTNTDATVTMDSTAKLTPGMKVSGTNVPAGAKVLSITNATTFELTHAATGTVSDTTFTFSGDYTIICYEPTNKHLLIIRDCAGTSSGSANTYMYSFITDTFSYNGAITHSDVKLTNPIIDYKNNVALGVALDEIETYDGESNITTTILHFKNDDFGLPDVVKKIYGITVEYSTDQNQDSALTYRITDSSGTSNSSFVGTNLSSTNLDDTNNDLDVKRFAFTSPISVASLQLKLRFGSSATLHTVNRVSVEYRPLYKRIT